MENTMLVKPILHVEVALSSQKHDAERICQDVKNWLARNYQALHVGQQLKDHGDLECGHIINLIDVADYTGPPKHVENHRLADVSLDVKTYLLKPNDERKKRRSIAQPPSHDAVPHNRILDLPNVVLKDEWRSLVYDDALPSRLLRYITRMVGMMKQPGLDMSAFNWNRLCLLYGPPGSGKSTLCRALAQKLSIRLSNVFSNSILVEINTNAMLSKYFGESGKVIEATFDHIHTLAMDEGTLTCVVMDEIETIAGSRHRSTIGGECNDALRATNQLLTALDRLRHRPNVLILCTSNLIGAIDQAFLDRVDIKELIPSPSPAAVYDIFRSCLNELLRARLLDAGESPSPLPAGCKSTSHSSSSPSTASTKTPSSATSWTLVASPEVPTLAETKVFYFDQPESPGHRLWGLAQRCEGFSGRTLRRLPILALAMYTWGGACTLDDAISGLATAVKQELKVKCMKLEDECMANA